MISRASAHLEGLAGHSFDVLAISRPKTPDTLVNLAKIISKLSPLIGNLIEFETVDYLNAQTDYQSLGKWHRQDPGFPDTIFKGDVHPTPGFEIKAWFPLATEITARFRDSREHFGDNQTYVCMLAWVPEKLMFGKPLIIDVCVIPALSVAAARDDHYHNPPDYLVIEPEDTSQRTRNLQQTNTSGHKFQGTPKQLAQAERLVRSWGPGGSQYSTDFAYQRRLRELISSYPYRVDTNYSKMDRIDHPGIESFKQRVLDRKFKGRAMRDWSRMLLKGSDDSADQVFAEINSTGRVTDR